MPVQATVQGLRALRRELKALDGSWPKELQKANKRAAGDVIVPAARGIAEGETNPKWGARAVGTIRPLATQTKAYVALGSAKVRWAAGDNFGSKHDRITKGRHSTNQFPRYKGPGEDYALLTAAERKNEQLQQTYVDMLEALIARLPDGVGPD